MLLQTAAASLLLFSSTAYAQLASLRATIPGSLHQCEATNLFIFDSSNTRPFSVLFVPSSRVTDSLRTGTTTVQDALALGPLQAIGGITTPDANPFDFTLQIEQGQVFEVFGFLPDGTGKALSLTRTVMTPLPNAASCLTGVQTTLPGFAAGGGGAAATTTTTVAPIVASTTTRVTTTTTTPASSSTTTSAPTSSSTTTTGGSAGAQTTTTSAPGGAAGRVTVAGAGVVALFAGIVAVLA